MKKSVKRKCQLQWSLSARASLLSLPCTSTTVEDCGLTKLQTTCTCANSSAYCSAHFITNMIIHLTGPCLSRKQHLRQQQLELLPNLQRPKVHRSNSEVLDEGDMKRRRPLGEYMNLLDKSIKHSQWESPFFTMQKIKETEDFSLIHWPNGYNDFSRQIVIRQPGEAGAVSFLGCLLKLVLVCHLCSSSWDVAFDRSIAVSLILNWV